jgi:hypothetical protein
MIVAFFLICVQGVCQTEITWKTLEDVKFTSKYFEEVEAYYYYPHFGRTVKALEGKDVIIEGFVLAIDPDEGFYVLSRNPFAACFFCGASGPESIVELLLKSDDAYFEMDEVVTIKGRLRLNTDDLDFCNYILEEAEVYAE